MRFKIKQIIFNSTETGGFYFKNIPWLIRKDEIMFENPLGKKSLRQQWFLDFIIVDTNGTIRCIYSVYFVRVFLFCLWFFRFRR